MDNAKYHRREATSINKCLSSIKKAEVTQRLLEAGGNEVELKNCTVLQLKELAKEVRFRVPLVVDEIAKRYLLIIFL